MRQLFRFLPILVCLPMIAWGRGTVCTMTLNSSQEIEVFKRNLKPQGFDFVDLTENVDPLNLGWFDQACKRRIQCDILVLSGHFGGTFFGSSGLQISLEHLNANRCMQTCDGMLKHPKEVFLFGCNTLAGKERDSRTTEEYQRVLMNDGIPEETAARVAAARYSPLGFSYRDRMLQVFAGVPVVHGFDSVSPSGAHVERALQNYFDRVGDYSQRLRELKAQQIASSTKDWDQALSLTSRASAPGAATVDHDQCGLYDPRYSTYDRLQNVEQLVNGKNVGSYLIMAGDFLLSLRGKDLDRSERALYQHVLTKSQALPSLLTFLPFFKPTDAMYSQIYKTLTLWSADPRVKPMLLAALKGDDTDLKFNLASEFKGTQDQDYIKTLIQILQSDEIFYVRVAAMDSLAEITDPAAKAAVQAALHDQNEFVRKIAAQLLHTPQQ